MKYAVEETLRKKYLLIQCSKISFLLVSGVQGNEVHS